MSPEAKAQADHIREVFGEKKPSNVDFLIWYASERCDAIEMPDE